MKKRIKIVILLATILVISVIIIGKDFIKDTVDTIPLSDYVKVSTTTINHGGIIKNRDDIPSNQNIPSDPIVVDISDEAIESWATCKNEEYGYEFKYPSGWFMYGVFVGSESVSRKEISACNESFIILSQKRVVSARQSPPTIGIRLLTSDWTKSLDEFLQTLSTELYPITTIEKKTIDGVEIIRYINQDSPQAIMLYKGNIFNVSVDTRISADIQYQEQNTKLLNAVLSTLKFTD